MITDEILRLQNAKEAIKASLIAKGAVVDDNAKLDAYASIINELPAGGSGGTSTNGPFHGSDWFNAITRNNTDYYYLFDYATLTDEQVREIETWDTSNVNRINYCFSYCNYAGAIDLSSWNASKVTDFGYLFRGSNFTSISIKGWDVSKATGLSSTFYNLPNCTVIDMTNVDTSKMKDLSYSIYSCPKLERIEGIIDLSSASSLSSSYSGIFTSCPNLKYVKLVNILKNVTLTNNTKWSLRLEQTSLTDECLIQIISELPDLHAKGLTDTSNIALKLPLTNTLTQEQVQVALNKGWTVANTTY